MAGIKIKDARLVSQVTDDIKMAASDISENTDAKAVSIGQVKEYLTSGINTELTDIENRLSGIYTKKETNNLLQEQDNLKSNKSETYTKNEVNSIINDIDIDLEFLKNIQGVDYCVGSWNEGQVSPEALEVKGNKEFATAWFPWLIDMTDNTGQKVTKKRLLKKNNWFRYNDGSFAPAVCITQEDWDECNKELFLDSTHTNKYCDAWKFDATDFYDRYGMDTILYNKAGSQIKHIRRPWETTNKDLGQFIGRKDTIYLCDQVRGTGGNLWKGIFGSQVAYSGANFGKYKLVPTALSPSPVCTVNGKTRSFFYLMPGEANCQNHKGIGNICDIFSSQKITYPRVNDMNQISNMKWSRANNSEPTRSFPFSEGGFHAYNTFLTSMECAYGTKYLHNPDLFSSGISSNDSCTDESTWKSHGGVRIKRTGTSDWTYLNWDSQSEIYFYINGSIGNMSDTINYYYPKAGVNEGQIAASYATECGIPEGTEFNLYGNIYWWKSPKGIRSLDNGEMNCRIYKKMPGTIKGYLSDDTPQTWDCEVILRIALIQGMNTTGDIFAYWGGGYEQIGTTDKDPNTERTGFPVSLYIEPNQTKWLYTTDIHIPKENKFQEESEYIHLADTINQGDNYTLVRHPYSGYPKTKGGSIENGECFYSWNNNYWGVLGKKTRIAARFRGNAADSSNCSSRSLHAFNYSSLSRLDYAGSAQVLI